MFGDNVMWSLVVENNWYENNIFMRSIGALNI